MAHSPKPFFHTARNDWYVQFGKNQITLHNGPKTVATEKAAWAAFHALMADRANSANSAGHQKPAASSGALTVAELFDKYLDWCQKHREKRTYDGYVWHPQKFLDHLKDRATQSALSLRPFHVVEWLDLHPGWGQTYRRNATGSIQRAYNWAEELGHIDGNPVRKIEKPMAKRRESFVEPADWVKIRDAYKPGDPFREFLEFCWETGCRPRRPGTSSRGTSTSIRRSSPSRRMRQKAARSGG